MIVKKTNTTYSLWECEHCQRHFEIPNRRIDLAKIHFCTKHCRNEWTKLQPKGKKKHSEGYILVWAPSHPRCNNQGYVPEHRLVLEKKLGYIIDSTKFHVHHIDGNKENNNVDNLKLLTPEDHIRTEFGWKMKGGKWFKPCGVCKEWLEVNEDNFYFRNRSQGGKTYKGSISCCRTCHKTAYTAKNKLRSLKLLKERS